MRSAALPLVALLALSACDSGGSSSFDIDAYTGAYTGTATLSLRRGTETTTTTAPVTVTIAKSGANVVTATIDPGMGSDGTDPDPIVFPGTYSDTGARFAAAAPGSSVVITVDGDGDLDGSGNIDLFGVGITLAPSGRITNRSLRIDVGLNVTSGNAETPTGSTGSAVVTATR